MTLKLPKLYQTKWKRQVITNMRTWVVSMLRQQVLKARESNLQHTAGLTHHRQKLVLQGMIFGLMLMIGLTVSPAEATIATANAVIQNEISSFVNAIINGNNPLSVFTNTLMIVFIFLFALKTVVFAVMLPKSSLEVVIEAALLAITIFVLWSSYDLVTNLLWGAVNGVALDAQIIAFGSTDPYFLNKYIVELSRSIEIPGISFIYDGIQLVMIAGVYEIVALGLNVAAKVATIWGTWGYSLAKAIGPLLIPFALLDSTRFLFIGWLRFFLGFLVFMMLFRFGMLIVAFQVRADFIDLGGQISPITGGSFTVVAKAVLSKSVQLQNELTELIMTGLLSLFFVYASGKAAFAIAGAAGGSSGATRSVSSIVTGFFKRG